MSGKIGVPKGQAKLTASSKAIREFSKSLADLGQLVETRVLYESPVPQGRLKAPLTLEVRRGSTWFFAALPELGIVEEGRTPDAAVKRCVETLFEVIRSYAHIPPQELSRQAYAHWRQLQAVAQLTNNGCHRET